MQLIDISGIKEEEEVNEQSQHINAS